MISTESRMISGLRRRSTPSEPVANRITLSAMYQLMSGPCIRPQASLVGRARVRAEYDAADGGDQQHDRGDLEREQVVGEEQAPDVRRRAEAARDVSLV